MKAQTPGTAALAALVLALAGCSAVGRFASKDDKKDDGEGDAAAEACEAGAETCQGTETAATGTETDDGLDEVTSLGLAEFCKFKRNDAGDGCFTCTPRDLPVTECAEVGEEFDPKKDCTHDLDRMTCKVGGGNTYGREFGELTKEEELYARIPILMFGAKALVSNKLTDDAPGMKELVLGVFDLITKYRKAIFITGELAPLAVEVEDLVRKVKPDLTEAQAAPLREAIMSACDVVIKKRDAGNLKDSDLLALGQEVLGSLPADVANGFLVNLDIETITENLKKSGSEQYIVELLIMFGGGQSLEDLTGALDKAE
jgi:hypothetical protein